jgi:hypothetical protein
MHLPKVIQVTPELTKYLEAAKSQQPMASLSKLVSRAALLGFQADDEGERLETLTPSLTVDFEV